MTFLQQVAAHYCGPNVKNLDGTVFILPNKRAVLHLRNEMKAVLSGSGLSHGPRFVSMNEFFQKLYGRETSDRISLLLALYECYKTVNPNAESLDEFIHWGNVMLSDFDNIDKYLADAEKIYVNVADFQSIQDTYEYLSENQKAAIKHFLSHFRDNNGRLTVNMNIDSNDVKSRFLRVWNILAPLYKEFNERLDENGLAYEGKIYRGFVENLNSNGDIEKAMSKAYPGRKTFVFVGLNALNECEKFVLRALRNTGMAEFVWDYSSKEIKDGRNRSSFFMKKNVEEFPQAFVLDQGGLKRPEINVVSVASNIGQTKLAPAILSGMPETDFDKTVFILPDEHLLMPLVSAIPSKVDCINITMGYPINESAVYSLAKTLSYMQMSRRTIDGKEYIPYRLLQDICSSSVLQKALSDEEKTLLDKVQHEAPQQVPVESLNGKTLDKIFAAVKTDNAPLNTLLASAAQNKALADYLKECISTVSETLTGDSDVERVEAEFASRYVEVIDAICAYNLDVLPLTWVRMLDNLLRQESVPFEGDALEGLQIMGTLETRALDFKNVVIMSANEEVFPHRSSDNSFIPPELRKGFGLPTTEYQDAVWAYYFYRLLQRAERVWLIYDSRTEGILSGEESRYIKQLQYHFNFEIKRFTAVAPSGAVAEEEFIEKTEQDIEAIRNGHLSASTMQSYLDCPVKFYYKAVKGLKDDDELVESIDAALLGTIFHAVMQHLYENRSVITAEDLQGMLADEEAIRAMIETELCTQARTITVEGRNIVVEEVILEYVKATLKHDLNLLAQSGSNGFRIIGLERYLKSNINGFNFIGFADRIDTYENGKIRIVDYKTGKVEDDDLLINDNNAEAVAEKLFGDTAYGRPKIALQLFLYDHFAKNGVVRQGEKVVNSIYSTAKLLTKPLPDVEECESFSEIVKEKLTEKLDEIKDTSVPWKRTCDKKVCQMCDFRAICGR